MTLRLWHRIRIIDWPMFSAISLLVFIGLVVLYSISINPIAPDAGIFRKQLILALLGVIIFFVASNMNYRLWMTYSKVMYLLGAVLLILVLFFGATIRGTTGWFSIAGFSFQPVEFAKVGLVIFLARYFSDHSRLFFMWRHIILSGAVTLLYMALVMQQPDFGSAIVIFGTWFLMLLIVGIPRRQVVILVSVFVVSAIIGWFFVLQPYQKNRIVTFLNPQVDELGVGYNVRQSIIAVGSGRIFGRGFGLGSQSQLKVLPEPETDFIFAVLSEEYGFVGVVVLFGGMLFLLFRLVLIAQRTGDNFAAFFVLGLASLFTVQSFINVGMNIGIAPVTGIPLPFISAGGSSLLGFFFAFGIASSVVADNRTLRTVDA